MVYSCTQQGSATQSGRKIHATTYTPEVGTVVNTNSTHSPPTNTSAKTPVKTTIKTESSKNSCDVRQTLSPSQTSLTSSNSNSSISSSASSKHDSTMLSPESGPTTPKSHYRSLSHEKPGFAGASPESQASLRRHILGNGSTMRLKDEPGISKDVSRSKDDQAINLSTSPRTEHGKLAGKHSEHKGERVEEHRACLSSSGRALPAGPGPITMPYRDIVHQSQFRDQNAPLNLVNNSSSSASASSNADSKDRRDNNSDQSRASSRDSNCSNTRPSAPVNPADSAGGPIPLAPGLLPPWAGLPYSSMGYMLPWDTMFREQLRSLPEEERRRLIEMGYIPPHLLLDAGIPDPRFPPSWPQPSSNPAPVPLVTKETSKTKIKSESNGRDRSPALKDGQARKAHDTSAARHGHGLSPGRVEVKRAASSSPAPHSTSSSSLGPGRSSQVLMMPGALPPGGLPSTSHASQSGQVFKADALSEPKTHVDIKPFNVLPQSGRSSTPSTPTSGPTSCTASRPNQMDESSNGMLLIHYLTYMTLGTFYGFGILIGGFCHIGRKKIHFSFH